ncbi:MAG: 2-C-methyl-D-erythritol 2,4-cyclodiphosphate synthase [Aminivibrio sp.]|jgi:2-C-methyl-D-erythritol 4-phosphate cytidylyltransferase/2-C-methyl-D-erythritol 2,4-cyclodiphosphate synthase
MGNFSLVVAAAGRGERAGGELPKQYRPLGGRMLWEWSAHLAEELFRQRAIGEAVFVVPPGEEAFFRSRLEGLSCPFRLAPGGSERNDSVISGVRCGTGEYVLIHDGARPFASPELCSRVMSPVTEERGIVPVLPVTDALKRLDGAGVLRPMSREGLFATQTPQGFHRKRLLQALLDHGAGAKDEGEAWSRAGHHLDSVRGEEGNFKITLPGDFFLAESRFSQVFRTGLGYDVHPLAPGRRFILGGVAFPDFPLGFVAHSDGDPLVHALCDAILGGAGLGDIGTIFPASDEKYKDISSLLLLRETANRAVSSGWSLEWADCVIIAQQPRLANQLGAMASAMNRALPESWRGRLNIKAKSGEGEGAPGRCETVECHVAATLSALSRRSIQQ